MLTPTLFERQHYRECRTLVFTRTFRSHSAAVEFHQVPDDRQSESQTPVSLSNRAVCLSEAIEHVGQKLSRNALSGIADSNLHVIRWWGISNGYRRQAHFHSSPRRRKFHGVSQQIRHYLLQPRGVAPHQTDCGVKFGGNGDRLGLGRETNWIQSNLDRLSHEEPAGF